MVIACVGHLDAHIAQRMHVDSSLVITPPNSSSCDAGSDFKYSAGTSRSSAAACSHTSLAIKVLSPINRIIPCGHTSTHPLQAMQVVISKTVLTLQRRQRE